MTPLPAGTVTLLMTDVADSTALWEADRAATRAALARHDEIAHQAAAAHDGTVVKSRGEGDSLFIAFGRATDAVAAAVELEQALLAEPWPPAAPIRVRMAINTGEVDAEDGDYRGSTVNRCARLRSLAYPCQILLTETSYDLVRDVPPAGASFRCLGECALRGLARPERVYSVQHSGLPAEFPPLPQPRTPPHNLPRQLTSFVGREQEIADVRRLLDQGPLLTLTGAGGSGKTRLALESAAAAIDGYPDGAWLVELAPLSDPSLVVQTIAAALKLPEDGSRPPEEAIRVHLEGKSLLLVLDNCEHLVSGCARAALTLLRCCPGLRILATSRQSLGVPGERTYTVPTLSMPDPQRLPGLRRMSEFEAVRLFVERAEAALPSFALSKQNASAIAQICRWLDGIPLSLELAAARVRSLAPEQIAARLDQSFRLLTGGSAVGLDRHRTLQATIDWSYDLLTDPERVLLRRLAVFAGGWTLEAAERVCADETAEFEPRRHEATKESRIEVGGNTAPNTQHPTPNTQHRTPIDAGDILDLLAALVDKSLVQAQPTPLGERYSLLETIRQYSAGRLDETDEAPELRDRHRDHFLEMAEEAEPHLQQADQKLWLDRLEAEHDNLRAALAWSVEGDARLRMAGALWRFWYVRGYLSEGRGWLDGEITRKSNAAPAVRAKALNGAGVLAMAQGDYDVAERRHKQALDLRMDLADLRGIASSNNNLGLVARRRLDLAAARAYYSESLRVYRSIGDPVGIAASALNLGVIAVQEKAYDAACELYEESLSIYRGAGDQWMVSVALHNLGVVANYTGKHAAGRVLLREAAQIKQHLGDPAELAGTLQVLGVAESKLGNHASAVTLRTAADTYLLQSDTVMPPEHDARGSEEILSAARQVIGDSTVAELAASAASMSLRDAMRAAQIDPIDSQAAS